MCSRLIAYEVEYPLSPDEWIVQVYYESFFVRIIIAGILPAIFYLFMEVYIIKDLQINENIRSREVRLIDKDGNQLGVVPLRKALELAEESKLDLVNVAPKAKPPVCKIIDYGKYKYETIKKEKESRKNQKTINVKEIRLSPNIDTHDLEVKAKRANTFLSNGDKVKVSVRFRGRELGHTNIGRTVLNNFTELVSENGTVDKKPAMEGRSMVMFFVPKNQE